MVLKKYLGAAYLSLLLLGASAQADIIVEYVINVGSSGQTDRTFVPQAATTTAANITAENLAPWQDGVPSSTVGNATGMAFLNNYGYLGYNGYAPGSISSPGNDYFEFAVNVAAGYSLDVSSISFGYRAPDLDGEHSVYWDVRSSADNYASSLVLVSTTTPKTNLTTGNLAIASLLDLTGEVTFRIYMYEEIDGAAVNNEGRISSLRLNGSVATIPEARTISMVLAAFVLIPLLRRFKRR